MTSAPNQIIADQTDVPPDGWEAVRADGSIQFAPIEQKVQLEPDLGWLQDLLTWLADLFGPVGSSFGSSWPVVKWVLIIGGAILLLILLWKLLSPILDLRRGGAAQEAEEWVPDTAEAVALLEDADRLAAMGRYDEATHLLLQRSVSQIAAARPDWVEPSSTARELASLPALPAAAKAAFGTIAARVEASLFALKRLGLEDWQVARSAYAEFALQRLAGDR